MKFKDLADLPEDERIKKIGKAVMEDNLTVGVVVDDRPDDPGKADRYIEKVKAQFPFVRVLVVFKGPIPHTKTIKFGQ